MEDDRDPIPSKKRFKTHFSGENSEVTVNDKDGGTNHADDHWQLAYAQHFPVGV